MLENLKLEVFNVYESAGKDKSLVSINTAIFKMISGTDEQVSLPIVAKGHDKAGNVVRQFDINGTPVWVRYNGKTAEYTNSIIMLNTDIKELKQTNSVVFDF